MSAFRTAIAAMTMAIGVATSAGAVPLVPTSYDMPNGNGTAVGGSFNYWDRGYSGIGSISGAGPKTADGEALIGGLGDLTDGVIPTQNWFVTESIPGIGPFVGWCDCAPIPVANPTIVFRFTPGVLETYAFKSVTLHLDDSNGSGGVTPPVSVAVSIDGGAPLVTPVADPASGDPFSLTIPLGGLPGTAVALTLQHRSQWIFLSEVTFEGDVIVRDDFGVPAPASLALFGIALVALAGARRITA